jgi:hypothetical protein
MKGITALFKVLTNFKLFKNTVKSKFKFGGEAMMFLLLNWNLLIADIQKMIKDTIKLILNCCQGQR